MVALGFEGLPESLDTLTSSCVTGPVLDLHGAL